MIPLEKKLSFEHSQDGSDPPLDKTLIMQLLLQSQCQTQNDNL